MSGPPLPAPAIMYPAAGNPGHTRTRRCYPMTANGYIMTTPVGPILINPHMTGTRCRRSGRRRISRPHRYIYLCRRRTGKTERCAQHKQSQDEHLADLFTLNLFHMPIFKVDDKNARQSKSLIPAPLFAAKRPYPPIQLACHS